MQRSNHRNLLIALNAQNDIARGHICRLAEALDTEWYRPQEGLDRLARRLGVPVRTLGKAQRLLPASQAIAEREQDRAAAMGARILTREDREYPDVLTQAPLPPPVLYVRGELGADRAVAIVGSRQPDEYGREAAHFFGHHLALRGVTVVSGFARGVDLQAHRGALEATGGRTIAVLGCGIDISYPRRHHHLVESIRQAGAVVSEFPLGTEPRARNFPVRNRIIAALGESTLVVQATPRSGSLITARYAMEMNRDVFALPGRIFDSTSLGPNALLRDGAGIALHPDDLLGEASETGELATETPPPLSELATAIWRQIPRGDTIGLDRLAARLDQPVDRLLGQLLELELGGWIHRRAGPSFARVRR